MCNALSPEKAVMWTVLYEGRAEPRLNAEDFTHDAYRRWFAALASGSPDAVLAAATDRLEQRALSRMLRVPPPPRVRAHRELLIQALIDRKCGKRMHIERLIN